VKTSCAHIEETIHRAMTASETSFAESTAHDDALSTTLRGITD
jgi:hypothetical protein